MRVGQAWTLMAALKFNEIDGPHPFSLAFVSVRETYRVVCVCVGEQLSIDLLDNTLYTHVARTRRARTYVPVVYLRTVFRRFQLNKTTAERFLKVDVSSLPKSKWLCIRSLLFY